MSARIVRAARHGAATILLTLVGLALLAPSALAAPPLNDAFAAGQLLSGPTATATGTNVEATKETAEPNHNGNPGGKSVWYRWTAPADGNVVVDTFGSSFDTLLAAYTGTTVDGLHRLASNDDASGLQSRVRFPATAGTEYRIAVDGYYAAQGSITLRVALGSAPANDNLANASVVSGSSASGTTLGATYEAGEPSHGGYGDASVWWSWTAPESGGARVALGETSLGYIAVYTGTTASGLVRVPGPSYDGRRAVDWRAVAGTTYRIAVASPYAGGEGPVQFALDLQPPPANDMFAAATDLGSGGNIVTSGTNRGAYVEPGEPAHHPYNTSQASVWYSWTAPIDGSLRLHADAGFAAVVAVYTGTEVSGLTRVPRQAHPWGGGPELTRVRVDAGVTYRIAVEGTYTGVGPFTLTLGLTERPPNDDFADAETLVGPAAQTTGTNVGATQEPGEPIHEENYYDPSVWYRWTAPASGGVTLDTAGSAIRPVVAIYTGETVSTLSRVPSTAANGTTREKRYFRAAAGVTYRIAIDGRAAEMGTFNLALSTTPPPANDMFAAAAPIAGEDATVSGDTLGATGENAEPGSGGGTAGATVWYQWTAARDGRASLSFPSADFPVGAAVYTGSAVGSLASATSSYSYSFRADAGTTYRIQVHGGARPWRGYFSLRLQFTPAPENDQFANAAVLTGAAPSATGTNTGATRETGEPRHCCGYGAQSVWWRWTAPADGRATLSLAGTSFDWVAGVYTGPSVDALTALAAADDGPLTFMAVEGTTYQIAVDGWSDSYYGSGPISLSLTLADAPANDFYADATVLEGSSDDATGTNVGASREYYEPAHGGYYNDRSVWYRWRAPASGQVSVDTAGSGFDTLLGVYTGTSMWYLTEIASNDDFGESPQGRVTFTASRGTVYRIAVDGKWNATGSVVLSLRQGTPPANDAFANATAVSGAAVQEAGSTGFATEEAGEPDHADDEGGASIWYSWTAPSDGALRASTAGSSIDTLLGVYTGEVVGDLVEVGANDDAIGDATASEVTIDVTEGTEYRIAIDGTNDRFGPVQGAVALELEFTAADAPPVEQLTTEPAGPDGGSGGGEQTETGDIGGGEQTVTDTGPVDQQTDGGGGEQPDTGDTGGGEQPVTDTGGGEQTETGPVDQQTDAGGGEQTDAGGGEQTDSGPVDEVVEETSTETDQQTTGGTEQTSGDDSGDGARTAAESGTTDTSRTSAPAPAPQTAASPASAPPAPAPVAPGSAPAPLTVHAVVRAQKISRVLKQGLTGEATCSAACWLEVTIALPSGLRARAARSTAIAPRTAVPAAAGASTPFVLKLDAATRRALKAAKATTRVVVTITARDGSGVAVATRRVALRR